MTQQENQANISAFAELEYMISSYFNKNIKSVVDSNYRDFYSKRNSEYISHLKNRPLFASSLPMIDSSIVAQEVRQTGEWNSKHSEYLMDIIHDDIYKDQSPVQHDLSILVKEWKGLAISRLGEAEYNRLSQEVGVDLASYYISHRIDDLTIQRLSKLGAPKSTFEYVLLTGFKESLVGCFATLNDAESPLDDRIKHLQDESFGGKAQFAGRAVGFGIDMLTPFAKAKGVWAALDIGGRAVAYAHLDKQYNDFDSLEKDLGFAVFGRDNAFSLLRSSDLAISHRNDGVQILNAEMQNKVFSASLNMDKVKAVNNALEKFVGGDTEMMVNLVRDTLLGRDFKIQESSDVPGWMLSKDIAWLIRNSGYYSALALEMKSKGVQSVKIGGRKWNVTEVAQRGYDYAVAGYKLQLAQVEKEVHDVEQQLGQQGLTQVSPDVSPNLSHSGNNNIYSGFQETPSRSSGRGSTESLNGWGDLFDTLGLSHFGQVGKNLGYVLAMLPDMLVGMFTGKTRNLKFGDNLLPIGAILAGMFVKNPFLKMLLIGLGGANLLNKAGQEVMANDRVRQQSVPQYRRYDDEPLDVRMKQPVMKGNTMVVSIDNIPSVITINDEVVDAYEKGCIPLNKLANAVLRKYDEQQQAIRQHYDREVGQVESLEVSRSLK